MKNVSNRSVPFCEWIRRRRLQLRLKQSQIADELRVTEESIAHWESGRRRPELNKIPRLAAALHVDPRELCRKVLDEWHPAFYDSLFTDRPQRMASLPTAIAEQGSSRKLLSPGPADGSALEPAVIVSGGLGEGKQLAE